MIKRPDSSFISQRNLTHPTEAATFRFEKVVLDQLRLEAEQKRINLNTLLNQIVKSHVEWHANAARAGMVPVRRKLVKKLFEPLTKEQIDTIAADVSRGMTDDLMMIMPSKRTEESIFELLERWIRVCGFNYHHKINDIERVFVIQHDMGGKWSQYLGRLFEHVSSDFMNAKPETEITENALYIRIKRERSSASSFSF
jgi:hypothetical protein